MSNTLVCIDCQQEKPLNEMCKHSGTKNGYQNLCKPCRSNRRYQNGEYTRERIRKHTIRNGKPTYYTEQRIIELMNTTHCTYCGEEMNHVKDDKHQATIDHVFIGCNIDNNVVACCRSCNASKGSKHVYDFYKTSDKFTYERWIVFVRNFARGILSKEPTSSEVLAFAKGFKDEAEELAKNKSDTA